MTVSNCDIMDSEPYDNGDRAPVFDLISSYLGPLITATPTISIAATIYKEQECIANKDDDAPPACNSSDISESTEACHHRIIIFTKDRPWQLQQLLRSMYFHDHGKGFDIFIICKVTNPYRVGYEKVKHEYEKKNPLVTITWLYESDAVDHKNSSFAQLLEISVYDPFEESNGVILKSTSLVMFLTDDCILLEPIEIIIGAAETVLQESQMAKRTLGFCTRLHPGVTYCQTKDEASPPPRSHLVYHQTKSEELDAFVYPQSYGTSEFAYPFDLSGGVYLQCTVAIVLDEMQRYHESVNEAKTFGYSHPNRLEINGNNAILRLQNKNCSHCNQSILNKDLLAIPAHPVLLILAINRVQDVYQAPLAKAAGDYMCENLSYTPETLLDYLEDDEQLNLSKYKATSFNSSHIGSVFLERPSGASSFTNDEDYPFALSVLFPVRNGPPSAASLAMTSILEEGTHDSCILPMQVVLVDDRCEDGSIDEMLSAARIFETESGLGLGSDDDPIDVSIRDHRHNHECYLDLNPTSSITIDVFASPSNGVGAALNHGLRRCKSEFVARMDADDVSCPRRLVTQFKHLMENPGAHVLGTNCVVFAESMPTNNSRNQISLPYSKARLEKTSDLIRSSIEPTDAGFVAWSMLFSCVIPHPSVMFRQSEIMAVGGYRQSDCITCTEDYDLWLRLVKRNVRSVYSLPRVGVYHRKHSNRSPNDEKTIRQRDESTRLSSMAMAEYVKVGVQAASDISLKTVDALKRPDDTDPRYLNGASELLCALELGFVKKHRQALTKNEIDLVKMDCNARIGELATLAVQNFGREATKGSAWNIWCERCPDLQMERIALLLHATSNTHC